MKWSKTPKSLTEKGEFSPHALPISGQFLKETLGASWHWQVGIMPRQVSAISRMRSPWNCRAGPLASRRACHSFTQAHRRVSKAQQKTCSLWEQTTRAPSILTLSRNPGRAPKMKGCCWITRIHRDSWPLEEKNSIRGQRRGLIARSFCVIKFY